MPRLFLPGPLRLPALLALLALPLPPARAQAGPAPARYPAPTAAEKAAADSLTRAEQAKNDALFRFFGAHVAIHSGYAAASYAPLNALLRQAGYPAVPGGYLSSALSYSVRIQKIAFALEGQFYSDHTTADNRSTAVSSSSAMFRLGYCFFNPRYSQCVTPSLGFAFTDTDFTLTDLTRATGTTAGGLLGGPLYAQTIHYQNPNLALGINYNYFAADETRRRAVLGLRLDYLVRLGDGRYSTYDLKQTVPGPPLDPLRLRICSELGFLF